MPSSDSGQDVNATAESLAEHHAQLNNAIATVLDYLVPDVDRRRGMARRSGRDRRDAQSDALYANRRSGRERRASADRRLPPTERLLLLRQELEAVIQRQEALSANV